MDNTNKNDFFTFSKNGIPTEIELNMATEDQRPILFSAISTIQQWLHAASSPKNYVKGTYKPLHATIQGSGGGGKSFTIKALVNTMRRMFGHNNVAHIMAPTGASANNVGGETTYRKAHLRVNNEDMPLTIESSAAMRKIFSRTLVVIIDERSMVSLKQLGAIERNIAETCHGGGHSEEMWGGIPVVLLVGDDYQLPAVMAHSAFHCTERYLRWSGQQMNSVEYRGRILFEYMAQRVFQLTTSKRQQHDQVDFKKTLQNVRLGETTEDDVKFLSTLHLNNFSEDEKKQLLTEYDDSLHLFATNQAKDEYNITSLKKINTPDKPVCVLKTKLEYKRRSNVQKHLGDSYPGNSTYFCIGAKVCLCKRNFQPDWGLFNNSIGTVKDIVFEKEGDNPNNGDHPLYVAVEFSDYCGPIWCPSNPKLVPIPVVTNACSQGCCKATFLPLSLCFATTIHKYQGLSVGVVPPGNPPNAIKRIFVDPGTKSLESTAPGLFYTALSRATTTGTGNLDSAIYFIGNNLNAARILNLTKGVDGKEYKIVTLRNKWVSYLNNHLDKTTCTESEFRDIISFSKNYIYDEDAFDQAILNKHWRVTRDESLNCIHHDNNMEQKSNGNKNDQVPTTTNTDLHVVTQETINTM